LCITNYFVLSSTNIVLQHQKYCKNEHRADFVLPITLNEEIPIKIVATKKI